MEKNDKKLQLIKYLLFIVMGGVLLYAFYVLFYNGVGFGTCFFTFIIPFIPLQLFSLVIVVFKISNKKKRTVFDYIAFVIISLTIVISSFSFASSDSSLLSNNVPPSLRYIYEPTYIISMIFSIIILLRERNKNIKK